MASVLPAGRVTQRAPQSCQRCYLKKIKCSKSLPCVSCTSLGIEHECQRETVTIARRPQRRHRSRQQPTVENNRSRYEEPAQDQRTPTRVDPYLSPETTDWNDRDKDTSFLTELTSYDNEKHQDDQERPTQRGSLSFSTSPNVDYLLSPSYTEQTHLTSISEDSRDRTDSLAEDAATTLEFLAWGRQRNLGVSISLPTQLVVPEILPRRQAEYILEFHRKWLTWMHNTINYPAFGRECDKFWNEGYIDEKAWLAVYYAMLCVGLNHMHANQQRGLGIHDGKKITQRLYDKTIESLKSADFMSVHTIRSVQAICIISLCAHHFSGSNLISVLLSCGIRIAQALNIHKLGKDTLGPSSLFDRIEREVRKSIWCFLSIQDWFGIPFVNSHAIFPQHCSTPLPLNVNDDSVQSPQSSILREASVDAPTHSNYLIIMHRVASVYRAFYDKISELPQGSSGEIPIRDSYEQVLKADTDLQSVLKSAPKYLLGINQTHDYPPYVGWQYRTFTISVAHKTLMIHRSFFLKSLKNKWYTYTRLTCIKAARKILEEYYACTAEEKSNDLWTIFAHVISASIILLLDMIFSEDEDRDTSMHRKLIHTSLDGLSRSEEFSSISRRGIGLIKILLDHEQNCRSEGRGSLDIRRIANLLQKHADGGSTSADVQFTATLDSTNWDDLMQSLDITFDRALT